MQQQQLKKRKSGEEDGGTEVSTHSRSRAAKYISPMAKDDLVNLILEM